MTSHDAQSQGANPSTRGALATPAATDDLAPRPVTTLELFFDPVFVFTITQLTELLVRDPHPHGILQLLLIFGVSYWMYGGYVWLTNYLPSTEPPSASPFSSKWPRRGDRRSCSTSAPRSWSSRLARRTAVRPNNGSEVLPR
jgi:hypothetical protein